MKYGYLANEGLKLNENMQIYGAIFLNVVNVSYLTIDQNRLATGVFFFPGGWVNF
jgi:hypothetical protein